MYPVCLLWNVSGGALLDTFLTASPAIFWNNSSILDEVHRLGYARPKENSTKPVFAISYGSLEQFPVRRRTETEEAFESRTERPSLRRFA